MKKIGSLLLAIVLVGGILMFVKADVNHGHGPGHDEAGDHGEETISTEHGEETTVAH